MLSVSNIMPNVNRGQSPAEADLNLLETARRCELYGMKMHPAKVSHTLRFIYFDITKTISSV